MLHVVLDVSDAFIDLTPRLRNRFAHLISDQLGVVLLVTLKNLVKLFTFFEFLG